ncbi:hypothetical protein E1890_21395 [Salmonella enterica subsp. enterica serovar Mountpleasant]|nr:hypothetical protein [Salmonella enterica subsp. enterica serovar Mountpleasant]
MECRSTIRVRLVILVGLSIDQIAQSGLSSLKGIYYSAQLFSAIPVENAHNVTINIINNYYIKKYFF